MIRAVWSGGMTGVDQAALRAARSLGITTGGYAPLGWLVETPDGRGEMAAPWLAEFGLVECSQPGYPARRKANVLACDAVVLIGDANSHGSRGLIGDCKRYGKPLFWVEPGVTTPAMTVDWLRARVGLSTLMLAGNRESAHPGIGERAERFLNVVFSRLMEDRTC